MDSSFEACDASIADAGPKAKCEFHSWIRPDDMTVPEEFGNAAWSVFSNPTEVDTIQGHLGDCA